MLKVYGHPLSSYCWKLFIALGEADTPYALLPLTPEHPEHGADWVARWPLAKMPLLVDGDAQVAEVSIQIEHLDLHHPGAARMIPADARAALPVRFMDRVFDNYVMAPMQAIVADRNRPEDRRDATTVEEARALLDRAYGWLETQLPGEGWACGAAFTLADCAAAPALYYADYVRQIGDRYPNLAAYRARLVARPSVARCIAGAQPYWHMFPFA